MNEQNQNDELLNAFENPETDPTPDIAPVMPDVTAVNNDAMMAPEFQQAVQEPVMQPEQQVAPVVPVTPSTPVDNNVQENVVTTNNVPVQEQKNVTQPEINNQQAKQPVDPSTSIAQENTNDVDDNDPNFLKKNLKFIIAIFAIIVLFIIFLPKIIQLLGNVY